MIVAFTAFLIYIHTHNHYHQPYMVYINVTWKIDRFLFSLCVRNHNQRTSRDFDKCVYIMFVFFFHPK